MREVRETETKAREEEKIYILVTNWFFGDRESDIRVGLAFF